MTVFDASCCLLENTDGKYNGNIYMVFEYMDHDLTGLADRPGLRFTIPQIKVPDVQIATYLLMNIFMYILLLQRVTPRLFVTIFLLSVI